MNPGPQRTIVSWIASPRANRSSESAPTSTLSLRPRTIISATARPAAGACITPWPEKPRATKKPGTPGNRAEDGVVVGRHLVEPGPAPPEVEARLGDGGKRASSGSAIRSGKSGSNAVLKPAGSSGFEYAIRTRFPSRRIRTPLSASIVIGIDRRKRRARPADEDVPADGLDGKVHARRAPRRAPANGPAASTTTAASNSPAAVGGGTSPDASRSIAVTSAP